MASARASSLATLGLSSAVCGSFALRVLGPVLGTMPSRGRCFEGATLGRGLGFARLVLAWDVAMRGERPGLGLPLLMPAKPATSALRGAPINEFGRAR